MADLYRELARLTAAGEAFVVATVVEAVGSTPRKAGAKMIVLADGSTVDTVGGARRSSRSSPTPSTRSTAASHAP